MQTSSQLHELSMDQLTSHHNKLVSQVHLAGGDQSTYRPVVKFTNRTLGVSRCRELEDLISNQELIVRNSKRNPNEPDTHPPGTPAEATAQAAAPPAPRAPRAPRAVDPNAPPTIRSLTLRFNSMVPEALSLGVQGAWVKEHTSDFANRDGANKQIDRLQAEIDKARAAPPKPTDGAGNTVGEPAGAQA